MSAYPADAFAVSAAAAAAASAIQLATAYRRSPFTDFRFGWRWFAIALLDATAGIAALAIVSALGWSKSATWLTGILGWVLVGVIATMVVRADLLDLPVGGLSVPVGFGMLYGALRSLVEPGLIQKNWRFLEAEHDGRLKWSLDVADSKGASLQFDSAAKKLRSYVSQAVSPTNPAGRVEALRKAENAIENAKKNIPPNGDAGRSLEAVKQLITFMVEEGYVAPLDNLLGRPTKADIRTWRSEAA